MREPCQEGFWIPLLLIHGELDKMVPSRHSRAPFIHGGPLV